MRRHLWRPLVQNLATAELTSKLDQLSQSYQQIQPISSLMGETYPLCHSKKKITLAWLYVAITEVSGVLQLIGNG